MGRGTNPAVPGNNGAMGTDRAAADPEVAALVAAVADRADEVADGMVERIRDRITFYGDGTLVGPAELRKSCAANIEYMLRTIVGSDEAPEAARETGRLRAEQGAPLPDVMAAYRVGTHYLWEQLVAAAGASGSSAALVRAASRMWEMQSIYTDAMTSSYRDVLAVQLVTREEERSALVEAVLEGRTREGGTAWEVADLLRLPHQGPYVVVVAEVPEMGRHALPRVTDRLGQLGLISAWRLLPDLQAGIVSLPREGQLDQLVDWLTGAATGPVGLSPPYADLDRTAQALRFARIALNGSVPDALVTVFDRAPLAVAAVGSPDVMARFADNVLGGLDGVPSEDRAILLDTFEAWLDGGGSANDAATRLYVHPNTVRYRLRRLEERTGRSLTDPRAVTELCLALEAVRRLG
jgi:hypothetical protein